MAIALDAHFSKADLMNAYINEIFLGQDGDRAIHGFGLASQFYFGKPLAELDLSEVALLVAIVRGPSVLRSAPACRARARAARPGAQGDGGAGDREAPRTPARPPRRPLGVTRAPGRCLLPGVPGFRAPHAAARLSRAGSDRGRADGSTPASSRAPRRRPSARSSASWRAWTACTSSRERAARRRGGRDCARRAAM